MSILKIKDENGNFIDIPAIKGAAGKSAYEQAVEGGFQGTEEEFIQVLASFGEYNKPSGSYVGNGEESRQINIGGIGNALLIWSDASLSFAGLVTPRGIIFFRGGTLQASETDKFENGVLYTNGNYVDLNHEGRTYYYQVL